MKPSDWKEQEDLTFSELSEMTGYGVSYLSEVFSGQKSCSFRLAKKLNQISNGKITLEDLPEVE